MRRTAIVLVLCACAGLACNPHQQALQTCSVEIVPPATQPTDENAAAFAALERRLSRVDFQKMDLENVIEFLRDAGDAEIVVDWDALGECGIYKESKVKLKLINPCVRTVLSKSLADVDTLMDYTVVGGKIVVTMREHLADSFVTRVYDVRDLAPADQLARQEQCDYTEACETLMHIIRKTVLPESWEAGRGAGTMMALDGKLIITNHYSAHARIDDLLSHLREGPQPVWAQAERGLAHKLQKPPSRRTSAMPNSTTRSTRSARRAA